MCSDVTDRQVAAQAIYLNFQIGQIKLIQNLHPLQAAILDLSLTTTPILPFGTCNVIMHKVCCDLQWF